MRINDDVIDSTSRVKITWHQFQTARALLLKAPVLFMAYNSTSGFSRLPEPSKPPLQRWQTMPTRSKSFSGPLMSSMAAGSPLRPRTTNAVLSGVKTKTPKAEYNSKSQPSSPTSTRKTPVRSKTPKASNPKTPMSGKKTPTVSCRYMD